MIGAVVSGFNPEQKSRTTKCCSHISCALSGFCESFNDSQILIDTENMSDFLH